MTESHGAECSFQIIPAGPEHARYAPIISEYLYAEAKKADIALSVRSSEFIASKIQDGKGIIALTTSHDFAGFCYIQPWGDEKYVSVSALISSPQYRGLGVGRLLKEHAFRLSREKYPSARIFGLTTNPAVKDINASLGYKETTYSSLPQDESFWSGCKTCRHYATLVENHRETCHCTAMMFEP